jgi:SAM-dependent methyltransferase
VAEPSASYAALRSTRKTHPLLVHAVRLTGQRGGRALDIGAGAHGETRYLLRNGFVVDAVDRDPLSWQLARDMRDCTGRLTAHLTDIREFPVAARTYDLVVALHVLPFLPAADLETVATAVVRGLRPGGVLCVTLFGERDSWVTNGLAVTPTTERRAAELFAGLRPLLHSEREFDGADAEGTPKHWHVLGQVLVAPGIEDR